MHEIIFLIALAFIWIVFASVQDLKTRIVANWISFSLIIFALGFRFFYSLFSGDFGFFYYGLIGFGIFFLIGNALYYGRMFAGGDAKLMIALGAVLPFYGNFYKNLEILTMFFLIFLFSGAVYGLFWSFILSARNFKIFKTEFGKQFKRKKSLIYICTLFGTMLLIFGFFEIIFSYLGILIFILPYFYIYAKAVDESCLVSKVPVKKLSEGDWLYNDLKINKKTIKAKWSGLSYGQIKEIKKVYQTVKIRQGIPFVPVFLISFLIFVGIWFFEVV
ncbi:MAG: prepilin peptidase [Nanoarchaeota archaeon]